MITHHQGQTFVEVFITLLFLSVSVISLIKFQNYLAYDNSIAIQMGEANSIGLSELETLRDFQVLNNTTGYTSYQSIATGTSTVNGNNATYSLSWTVTSYTNPTYKTIDLTVSWTDRYNQSQSIELTTDVAGLDPSQATGVI